LKDETQCGTGTTLPSATATTTIPSTSTDIEKEQISCEFRLTQEGWWDDISLADFWFKYNNVWLWKTTNSPTLEISQYKAVESSDKDIIELYDFISSGYSLYKTLVLSLLGTNYESGLKLLVNHANKIENDNELIVIKNGKKIYKPAQGKADFSQIKKLCGVGSGETNFNVALMVVDISEYVTYEGTKYADELKTEVLNVINVINYANNANWEKIVFYLGPDENTKKVLKDALDSGGKKTTYLSKPGNSAFCILSLDSLLKKLNVNRLVIVGLNSGSCVYATANDAVSKGYEVITSRDLIMPDKTFDGSVSREEKITSYSPTYGEIQDFYLKKTTFFNDYKKMLDYLK
jgi:hypothetical protein